MTPQIAAAIDAAMRALVDIANVPELGRLDISIRCDGRVDFVAKTHDGFCRWRAHADIVADGVLPVPSEALKNLEWWRRL